MSMPKSYPLYAVWIGTDQYGYEQGKAYYIDIMMYPKDTRISIITKNDERIEYEHFIQFLYAWRFVRLRKP